MFHDVGKLDQIAINLYYGWGYNFHPLENQLRTDDLIMRERIGWLPGQSRAVAGAVAQSACCRQYVPLPSRARPLPEPDAVEAARSPEQPSTSIDQLEGSVRSLPAPETEHLTQRYRNKTNTLMTLGKCDERLVGLAEELRQTPEDEDDDWIVASLAAIRDGIALITGGVHERQFLLK